MKRSLTFALLLTAGFPASLPAQDRPTIPPFLQGGESDPRQEMVELFGKVERRLNEIDKLLYDAGSGSAALSSQKESGIAELLERSKSSGKEVLSDIDRILEIARQQGGT